MNSIESFIWLNTFLAIIGTVLNARQVRFGFILWMITNAVFVGYNLYIGSFAQATLFAVYFGLAVFGWISWGKKEQAKQVQESV